jgi:hypothetical protein
MNNFFLSITTLFLFFPISLFLLYNKKKTIWEIVLALLLLINIIISFLFWTISKEKSLIHFYDGIFAKISYILFSIYILFIKVIPYKIKLLFLIILFLSSIIFYYSDIHSTKNWCSKEHLIFHSIFHFLISIGCCVAFI